MGHTCLYLKKIQIKPTDTCTLCKETVETIVHLFFECEKATYLWNELHHRILDVIHVDVNFTLKTVLFGERSYTCNKPINIILLATKQYLYTCSKKEKYPNIMELLFVLHQKYVVEKLVAYKNLNSRKFTKTWGICGKPSLNDVMRLQLMLMCKMFFQTIYFAYP